MKAIEAEGVRLGARMSFLGGANADNRGFCYRLGFVGRRALMRRALRGAAGADAKGASWGGFADAKGASWGGFADAKGGSWGGFADAKGAAAAGSVCMRGGDAAMGDQDVAGAAET
jgi:hypothetical protein